MHFDYEKEFLMVKANGVWKTKPEVTREQMERMYKRIRALQDAHIPFYNGGMSIAERLRDELSYNPEIIKRGPYMYLQFYNGSELRLRSKEEKAYVQTVLNYGDYSRNY
jgi:hypothetical protein